MEKEKSEDKRSFQAALAIEVAKEFGDEIDDLFTEMRGAWPEIMARAIVRYRDAKRKERGEGGEL